MRCVAQVMMLMVLLGVSAAIAQDTVGGLRAMAVQGDYDAQRGLAGCLGEEEGECAVQPEPDPVQACTWRMIILTSEHPRVGDADEEMVGTAAEPADAAGAAVNTSGNTEPSTQHSEPSLPDVEDGPTLASPQPIPGRRPVLRTNIRELDDGIARLARSLSPRGPRSTH